MELRQRKHGPRNHDQRASERSDLPPGCPRGHRQHAIRQPHLLHLRQRRRRKCRHLCANCSDGARVQRPHLRAIVFHQREPHHANERAVDDHRRPAHALHASACTGGSLRRKQLMRARALQFALALHHGPAEHQAVARVGIRKAEALPLALALLQRCEPHRLGVGRCVRALDQHPVSGLVPIAREDCPLRRETGEVECKISGIRFRWIRTTVRDDVERAQHQLGTHERPCPATDDLAASRHVDARDRPSIEFAARRRRAVGNEIRARHQTAFGSV